MFGNAGFMAKTFTGVSAEVQAAIDAAVEGAASAFDPAESTSFFDDFLGENGLSGHVWNTEVAGTGTVAAVISPDVQSPGVVRLRITAATDAAFLKMESDTDGEFPTGFIVGGGPITFKARVRISALPAASGQEYLAHFGLGFGYTNPDGAYDEIAFFLNGLVSNFWRIRTAQGGSANSQTLGTSPSVDTWYTLSFVINAAGTSIEYFIDGVSVGTRDNSIMPGNRLLPAFGIRADAGADDRDILVDYVYVEQTFTTPR